MNAVRIPVTLGKLFLDFQQTENITHVTIANSAQ